MNNDVNEHFKSVVDEFIRRTDDTRDMNIYELTIAHLNVSLKEKNAEIERLKKALREISDDGVTETPSAYFEHCYDDCVGCRTKVNIADAALKE